MSKLLRAQRVGDQVAIADALVSLRMARTFLKKAGAVRAEAAVKRALKSVEGAQRHAARLRPASTGSIR